MTTVNSDVRVPHLGRADPPGRRLRHPSPTATSTATSTRNWRSAATSPPQWLLLLFGGLFVAGIRRAHLRAVRWRVRAGQGGAQLLRAPVKPGRAELAGPAPAAAGGLRAQRRRRAARAAQDAGRAARFRSIDRSGVRGREERRTPGPLGSMRPLRRRRVSALAFGRQRCTPVSHAASLAPTYLGSSGNGVQVRVADIRADGVVSVS